MLCKGKCNKKFSFMKKEINGFLESIKIVHLLFCCFFFVPKSCLLFVCSFVSLFLFCPESVSILWNAMAVNGCEISLSQCVVSFLWMRCDMNYENSVSYCAIIFECCAFNNQFELKVSKVYKWNFGMTHESMSTVEDRIHFRYENALFAAYQ